MLTNVFPAPGRVLVQANSQETLMNVQTGVAEGTAENVFVVKDGVLYTPPVNNTLDGVTRRTLIRLAENDRIRVQVQNMTVYDLCTADEVFFASTAVPIGQVNGRRIGKEWPGPLTKMVQELYLKEVSKA